MPKHVHTFLSSLLPKQENWKVQLLSNWQSIMGNLHTKVQLEKIYEDTLVLGVHNSAWLQELYLLSPMLLSTINQKLDQPRIKHLRFKQAGTRLEAIKKGDLKTNQRREVILNADEHAALNKMKDPQLREALKAFLIRCYQERV
jgi:hypothetical protein